MKRKMVTIDESKCDGCGQCVPGCKEGALQVIDGKARLVSDVYCDGLGACLGECPRGAISIEEREAAEFDAAAAERHVEAMRGGGHGHGHDHGHDHAGGGCPGSAQRTLSGHGHAHGGGCPGSAQRTLAAAQGHGGGCPGSAQRALQGAAAATAAAGTEASALGHWPVQLRLVSPAAPFLRGADLLVCADCVPFALPNFHSRYLAGRVVVVGCPKLDDLEHYREKLAAILHHAQPRSVTVLRMEVPCCGGIAQAVLQARDVAQPDLPVDVHVVRLDGSVAEQRVAPLQDAE